mgnify:CR=1 FL=1
MPFKKTYFVSLVFGLILVVAGSIPVWADNTNRHTFEFGPEIYYYDYEESGVMEEDGVFYGLEADYTYHNYVGIGLNGRLAYGNVDYTSPASGSIDGIDDLMLETRATLGWDWTASERIRLTPFTGFGYRYLNDDTSGMSSTTGALGYERIPVDSGDTQQFCEPLNRAKTA